MAIPIVQAIISKAGRTLYKKGSRFISKSDFLRESRRIPRGVKGAGRFLSRAKHARALDKAGIAQRLLEEIGAPIGGGDWVSRVRKSTERFTDLLADDNQLG